jgi:hypothetical protein
MPVPNQHNRRMLKKAVQQMKTVIWFFWVCLVCLVKQDQQDEQNKPDRPNEQDGLADFLSILVRKESIW